jgi:2-keto-3-deoxy-L-fuconate dehydrogenase
MLSGKTVLVTGAGQGIGLQTARLAIERGAALIALDRDAVLLQKAYKNQSVVQLTVDVTDPAALARYAEVLGAVDCVVNGAAIVSEGSLTDSAAADLRRSLEVNVMGIHNVLALVVPGMLGRQCGSIVNIASIVSSVKGLPNRYVYGTTKGAVIGMTKAIAADFVRQGIRCNAVCPGTVDTPSLRERAANAEDPVKALAEYAARQPMGRLGRSDEIAPLICHLLSDESTFTTGGVFVCDGGVCI